MLVLKAREFLGTPWHHGARVKGVGIDCTGLIIEVLNELGFQIENVPQYGASGDLYEQLEDHVARYCDLTLEYPKQGDILLFHAKMMYNHCGFFAEPNNLIHSSSSPSLSKVVEHQMDDNWWKRVAAVYRINQEKFA